MTALTTLAAQTANVGDQRAYLAALDRVLVAAVSHACERDPTAATDRWRGLHLNADGVTVLARTGSLLVGFQGDFRATGAAAREDRAFALLAGLYGLSDLELAAVVLAIAPEIDERYGRLFGFLHDDLTRRLPTTALALDILCATDQERERLRSAVAVGGRLAQQHILRIDPATNETAQTAPLRIDPQIRQLLLGEPGTDPRLATFCSIVAPQTTFDDLDIEPSLVASLRNAAARFKDASGIPLRLILVGPEGCGQEEAIEAIASEGGLTVLTLDARGLLSGQGDVRLILAIFRREALLADALVRITHADALDGPAHVQLRGFIGDELHRFAPGIVLFSEPTTWIADAANHAGFTSLAFDQPTLGMRAQVWANQTNQRGLVLGSSELETLAARFRLTHRQIGQAANRAAMTLMLQRDSAESAFQACFAGAAAQGGHELARLTQRIMPRFTWADIVTTAAIDSQLREICARVQLSAVVLERWRFADKLALGRGVSALFAGPPGTGKTMAAEVIAGALGIDLFKIELASVVSKYIGETEQNLDRIFRAAEDVNGILLFDEADALFGKRSEVRDAHDRYANLEISYLLQKMEEFQGIAILSTNLQKNLDDAFTRRLSFIVHFPFPDVQQRERIWDVVWPSAVPREPGLSFKAIAETFKLSGGNIKSAALAAAYHAAADDTTVGLRHIMRAIEREYEKLGRPLKPEDVAPLLEREDRS